MQRPTSQLGHHLLTRSDLAAMAIRATEVFRWLADGAIEQVGDLPRAAREPDPVFAVNNAALRAELVARLAAIGKSPVVLTPLGVRSFLLRTLLLGRNTGDGPESEHAARELVAALDPGADAPPPDAATPTPIVEGVDADVVAHLLETDLAAVLQDALQEVAPDVEAMLQLAAEIAAAESAVTAREPWAGPDEDLADESDTAPDEPTSTEPDEPEVDFDFGDLDEDEDEELDACFDLDELTKLEAAVHAAADEPEPVNDSPLSQEEAAMDEEFDAPRENLGDDLQQHHPESTAAATPTPEPGFEQLFAPEPETAEQAAPDAALAEDESDFRDEDTAAADSFEEGDADDDAIDQAFDEVIEAVAETIESSAEPFEAATGADATPEPASDEQPEPQVPTEQPQVEPTLDETPAQVDALTADAEETTAEDDQVPTGLPVDGSDEAAAEQNAGRADEGQISDQEFEALAAETEPALAAQPEAFEPAGEPLAEPTFDETPAPIEASTADEIEHAPDEPEPTTEELQNVNEAQTGEATDIEVPAELGAATSSNELGDSAEGLLSQAVATIEAEHAGEQATTTDEPLAEPALDEQPSFDEGLVDAVSAAVEAEMTAVTEPGGDEFALTSQAMDKVQDFLGELRGALVEMAQRPQAQASTPPIDVAPLIQAVQAGFDRSAEQATQASTALASLAERVGQFGQQVEASVQQSVKALAEQQQRNEAHASVPVATVDRPRFLVQRPGRQALVLGAVAILVLCWSILFWFKTGSPRLAFGTLIGANLVGCCLLVARRD
ncbi:MAG: hypothetical protein R3F29_05120 [Planctomycetota bacterium]